MRFRLRCLPVPRRFKNRTVRYALNSGLGAIGVFHARHLMLFDAILVARAGGYVNNRVFERLYTLSKKRLRVAKRQTRIWGNLQMGLVISKKAKNSRMGKGRGGYNAVGARVYAGAPL